MFWETQRNLFKIPFKKLEISEDADISQKKPGAYGAVKKLPKPENPTHYSTYYGQKNEVILIEREISEWPF